MRKRQDRSGPAGEAAQNSRERGCKNADQDSAIDLPRHEDQSQDEAEAGGLHFPVGEIAQADESSRVCDYELGIAQADESDEHSDARGGRVFQAIGHAVDNLFADAGDSQNQEEHSGKENHRQRRRPRNVHVEADGIGEVGVQRHPRGEGDGIVGVEAHHQRGSGRGDASGEYDAFGRHSRLRQNLRVHDDDVGHGYKSREAAQQALA